MNSNDNPFVVLCFVVIYICNANDNAEKNIPNIPYI